MKEEPISITLRIRNKNGDLVLQLETQTGEIIEEPIPTDLKLDHHNSDFRAYSERFLKEVEECPEFSEMGNHLFALLHLGAVGQKWKDLADSRKGDQALRVLLDIEAIAEGGQDLILLPWELIVEGTQRPFQEMDDTIVRVRNYQEQAHPKIEHANWPIRLLIVIGVNDSDIGASEEVEKIEDVLRDVNRLVDVEVMDCPDINELEQKCKKFRPHVFHYIGHGGVDSKHNTFIHLRGPADKSVTWSANEIGTSLKAWGWIPRFAFINACRTAAGANPMINDQVGAWGVSEAFQRLRVPAVLTMQANIKGTLAGAFAGALYDRLARGESIDCAIAAARIKIRDNTRGDEKNNKRDWATPTLTICLPPEKILPSQVKVGKERLADIKSCTKFQEVSILANCREDRRQFIYGFYPIPPKKPDKSIILVRGNKESGKTWVTLWCLEGCALQNHNVRYVELVSDKSPKWLDVLTQIQLGDESKATGGRHPLIYRPLDPKAFNEFNHELRYRIKNETPPDWDGNDVAFKELDLKDLDNLPTDTVKNIFKSFRKALLQACEVNHPLIIVLDQFTYKGGRISDGHMEKFLIPYLFEEVAVGNLQSPDKTRSVKFVFVMNDEELEIYAELMNKLRGFVHEVHLEGIPSKDFEKVVKEYLRNLKATPRSFVKNLGKREEEYWIDTFRKKISSLWHPSVLGRLQNAIEYVHRA